MTNNPNFVNIGRAPALTTNLAFIFLAPFFEWFTLLNYLTGYREEDRKKCRPAVIADIAHYRL